jgi:hypothetical protein
MFQNINWRQGLTLAGSSFASRGRAGSAPIVRHRKLAANGCSQTTECLVASLERRTQMGTLTFSINVTLDRASTTRRNRRRRAHAFFTGLMERADDAVGPRHLRDDGATCRRSPAATSRHCRRCASGRASGNPSRSTWCRRHERTSRRFEGQPAHLTADGRYVNFPD